jgi:hypothetical protein
MRSVAPNQPELEAQFELLVEHTREIVSYKKLGTLGVTLLMLDPVLHTITDVERHKRIPVSKLQKLGQEVNEAFGHTQHDIYNVPIVDRYAPYGLYGYGDDKPYLGLRLGPIYEDEQLTQDRELVINHIAETYPVDERTIRKGLIPLKPHITLGTVNWDALDIYQQEDFKRDPNAFISSFMRERVNLRKAEKLVTADLPVFPETICLNGLQAFCEPQRLRRRKTA